NLKPAGPYAGDPSTHGKRALARDLTWFYRDGSIDVLHPYRGRRPVQHCQLHWLRDAVQPEDGDCQRGSLAADQLFVGGFQPDLEDAQHSLDDPVVERE